MNCSRFVLGMDGRPNSLMRSWGFTIYKNLLHKINTGQFKSVRLLSQTRKKKPHSDFVKNQPITHIQSAIKRIGLRFELIRDGSL